MMYEFEKTVHEPKLLRVMIQMRKWEEAQCPEFQTLAGRDLYFRIASIYLENPDVAMDLKQMHDPKKERIIRSRLREFERAGFIETLTNTSDLRTKKVMPTSFFLMHLNEHLNYFKKVCDTHFLIVEK